MRFAYYQDLMFFNGSAWDRYFTSQSDDRIDYDVIVIGSGMGGGILGVATSDRGLRTLVLEAGPIRHLVNVTDLPVAHTVESFNPYELAGNTRLDGGVCFNLGGRSIFWSAVIPRMLDWELTYWPNEIAEYLTGDGYARAEQLFRKRTEYPEFQRKLVGRVAEGFPDYSVTHLPRSYHQPDSAINPRPGSPDERTTGVFSTAALLADAVLHGKTENGVGTLHVALEHLVDRIILDGSTAVSVEVLDLRQRQRKVFRGKHIIMACGATESPRLALTSSVADPCGLVGVGLVDHPEAEIHFDVPSDSQMISGNDQGNVYLRHNGGDGPPGDHFSCELALNHKFWDVRIEDDTIWKQEFGHASPAASTIKFLFRNPLNNANNITVEGDRYRVFLKPMGRPLEAEARLLGQRLLRFFGVEPEGHPLRYLPAAVTYHLGGSMRMGEPGSSVVNADLRFHEYDNLYCCDLSVFPDIPAANPSLTLGALALRLADDLRARCT